MLRWDQALLAVTGVTGFILGVTVNRDRSNLAVALVGIGAALVVLATVLPRLGSLTGKFAGTELSLSLVPTTQSVTDRVLVQPNSLDPNAASPQDLRGAAPFTSTGSSGFGAAVRGGPAAYVIVNLENGRAWLSSRLYLFVQALAEVRGVEAVVFTNDSEGHDVFLGVSSVCDLVSRLAFSFPWLAQAFGTAWDQARRSKEGGLPRRRLSTADADALYDAYVQGLRAQPATLTEDWHQLADGVWEHAQWLDRASIIECLGASLSCDYVVGRGDEDAQLADATAEALAVGRSRYVAVVNASLEVRFLVDRWRLIDRSLRRGARAEIQVRG
jgi:hypothetical protein